MAKEKLKIKEAEESEEIEVRDIKEKSGAELMGAPEPEGIVTEEEMGETVSAESAGEISEKKSERIEQEETHIYKRVKSIVFSILSPTMIKNMASAKIVTPELYDKEGYPVDGGLMDIRLGVIDPGLRCKTCGSKLKECIGHFGYIELARPIIHIKFVNIVHTILKEDKPASLYSVPVPLFY